MLEQKEIEGYIGKVVSIGIPHRLIPGELFFYYGILLNVSENTLKIKINNGYRIIPIEEIRDIHLGRK